MTPTINRKKDAAIEAISAVHSDQSGGLKNNLEALQELRDEVNCFIEAIESDINREEAS